MSVTSVSSRNRLLIRALPLLMFAVAIIALFVSHADVMLSAPQLFTFMNTTLFLAAIISGVMATIGFLHGGMMALVVLASGVFTFGVGNLVAPVLIDFFGTNAGVTAHNILAMSAALQLLYAVAAGVDDVVDVARRRTVALQVAAGSATGAALVILMAALGILPDFISADGTGSNTRSVVLTIAVVAFGAAAVVSAVIARETRERFLRWYALGLGFIALGLAAVSLGPVGSLIGWVGRGGQLVGQCYILASLYVALKQPVPAGAAAGAGLASSFQRVQSALAESRAEMNAAMRSMTDGVAITDAAGNFTSFNEAFLRYHRFEGGQNLPHTVSDLLDRFEMTHLDGRRIREGERPIRSALSGQTAADQEFVVTRVDTGETWLGSYSYAPIRTEGGELAGAVVVARDITERKRDEERLRAVLESERRRRSLMEALHGVMDVAVSSMETREVAERMLRYLIEHHGFEMGGIWLAEGDELKMLVHVNFPEGIIERFESLPVSSDYDPSRTYASGELVFVDRPEKISRPVKERYEQIDAELGAYVIVPLRSRDRIIGTLHFGWHGAQTMTDEDRDFYLSLGYEFGAVLDNARLFGLERDVAETLQETLIVVPSRIPGVAFSRAYESATLEKGRVGGDFIDVFQVQGPLVGVSLGDVSGKGIDAAVTTSLIRTTLRVHALDGLPPSQVAMKANAVMRRFTETDSFVTLWFGLLNTKTGQLRYVTAGHPPGIVVSSQGALSELTCGGPIMGAFDGMEYHECQSVLVPGDRLVLYSDGVTEARSPDGRFLHAEGLAGLLVRHGDASTADLAPAIMKDVVSFSGGLLRDDAAILAVEAVGLRERVGEKSQLSAF